MTKQSKIFAAIFVAGFFAKDLLDCIFLLMANVYPIPFFGFEITATSHKIMLVISTTLIVVSLYYYYSLINSKK